MLVPQRPRSSRRTMSSVSWCANTTTNAGSSSECAADTHHHQLRHTSTTGSLTSSSSFLLRATGRPPSVPPPSSADPVDTTRSLSASPHCISPSSSSSLPLSSSHHHRPLPRLLLSSTPVFIFLLIFSLLSLSHPVSAVRFYMHDRERRCFRFESEYDSLVNAHASIANGPGLSAELSVEIRDSRKHLVYTSHRTPSTDSSFSFRTPKFDPAHMDRDLEAEEEEAYDYDPREMEGWFETCLILSLDRSTHDPNARRAISFWIRPHNTHGDILDDVHAHNTKASDEQVQGVTRSLQDIQDVLKRMITDIVILQQRERRLVDHTKATSKRLVYLALFCLSLLVVVGFLQFMHYKTYFKSKKLI